MEQFVLEYPIKYSYIDKAFNTKTGKTYALKQVKAEDNTMTFPITAIREIKLLSELSHKNIIKLHEVVQGKKREK